MQNQKKQKVRLKPDSTEDHESCAISSAGLVAGS